MVGQEILVLFIMVRIRCARQLRILLILRYAHYNISLSGECKHINKKTGTYDVKNPVEF